MSGQPSIYGLTREELAQILEGHGQPRYRADQVFNWIYVCGVGDPDAMTDVPKAFRAELANLFDFRLPAVAERRIASDRTVKYRLELHDDKAIECVMMPDLDDADEATGAVSMCISSQVGCALRCGFCATGTMGRIRDLTAAEIVGQVVLMLRELTFEPTSRNILFMGMGEPLLNLEHVNTALDIFGDAKGLAFPMRRITVSTAGIPDGMRNIFERENPPRLALSLHAPDQELRSRIMPISRRYELKELIATCRELPLSKREKFTMEYILLADVNDSEEQARSLAKLLGGLKAKVNLIPHNAWPGIDYIEPTEERVDAFMRVLRDSGVRATVRRSRGRDASAACGQLAIEGARRR